jgi:hypothetical protein
MIWCSHREKKVDTLGNNIYRPGRNVVYLAIHNNCWPANPEAGRARSYLTIKTHRIPIRLFAAVSLLSFPFTAFVASGLALSVRQRVSGC